MATSTSTNSLGTVLVVGGCGFLGHHIVKALLKDPDCGSIHVLSRNPTQNLFPGVSYHAGNITSADDVGKLLDEIKPKVIFHTASPVGTSSSPKDSNYVKINVDGTSNLLAYATRTPSVVAFVYSSTAYCIEGLQYTMAKETAPLRDAAFSPSKYHYFRTKGIAETLVLQANRKDESRMRTAAIRPPTIFGEGDVQLTPGIFDALTTPGGTAVQIGSNTGNYDFVYVTNLVDAHMLAAKALVSDNPKIGGEAFVITNDEPMQFWTFVRKMWKAAEGGKERPKPFVLPKEVALLVASLLEWIVFLFTFGQRTTTRLTSMEIEQICFEKTFCIDKAKEMLGYRPYISLDEGIERTVNWAMENGKTKSSKTE